jgi:hypothetical protein
MRAVDKQDGQWAALLVLALIALLFGGLLLLGRYYH